MFHHVTVLLKETVDGVVQNPHGIYVDMTLGGGGHSHEIASRLAPDGFLIGIDRDSDALQAPTTRENALPDSFSAAKLYRNQRSSQ